jgi:lipopolysaccharide transport system permease protein
MGNSKETIIRANRTCLDLELKDFFKYRDLLYLLIRRDIVTSYKQTILGPLWVVIQALMGSAVFTIIFGNIAGLSTDGHPAFLFYLCGMIGWQYFGSVLGIGSHSLQSNFALFAKVYFPRLIPPIGQAISSLLNLAIQLLVFFLALFIYNQSNPETSIGLSSTIILLPILIFQTATLGLGLGFIISAMSVKYRDLARISGLFTQFIMYASPVIYPISEIPEKYQEYMALNPLTFIIESYRLILLGNSTASNLTFAIPSIASTIIIFLIGLILYNKAQRTYVDFI